MFGLHDRDIVISRILYLCLILLCILAASPSKAMQVITHASINVESMTTTQLRRIYSIRQLRWANSTPIVVFVLPSQHIIHKNFSKNVLNIFPYKLDRIWNKLTFSGLGVAPTIVESQEELLKAVSSTPGAIGYVDNLNKEADVNVIKISI